VTGDGDIVWVADNHNETWNINGTAIPVNSSASTAGAAVIYRGDLDGEKFTDHGTRPVVNMRDRAASRFEQIGSTHIRFEHIDFTRVANTTSPPYRWYSSGYGSLTLVDCTWDEFTAAENCVTADAVFDFIAEDSDFLKDPSLTGQTMLLGPFIAGLRRCNFNGWDFIGYGCLYVNAMDCDFGVAGFTGVNALFGQCINTECWGCKADSTTWTTYVDFGPIQREARNTFQDDPLTFPDPTVRQLKEFVNGGTITTSEDPGNIRPGGALTVRKCRGSTAGTVLNEPLLCWQVDVYAPANVTRSYTIYMKATGWGGNEPDETELLMYAIYYATAGEPIRTWKVSTTAVNGSNWTGITVPSVTPAESGPVTLRVVLNRGQTGADIWIDPKIEIV
jgi:hypothetical protein